MRLDGDAWQVAHSTISVDTPLTVSVRAYCLLPRFTENLVLTGLSAAWAWGALVTVPTRIDVAKSDGSRVCVRPPNNVRVRDLVWHDGDLVSWTSTYGTTCVTTPGRTISDIARYETDLSEIEIRTVLDDMDRLWPAARSEAEAGLRAVAHLPYKARALARLTTMVRTSTRAAVDVG